ncbi:hypothetical protein EVAR_51496_1 [Eumeta japonica]|uniref:Uncharacterized protein n=1 Tax=Eumeta variegata TaxID=151549 RepID=A0A4C1XCK4_EUMVA|nr:hypothetical protein EVAR_51496_1 [Eumeta japonica]
MSIPHLQYKFASGRGATRMAIDYASRLATGGAAPRRVINSLRSGGCNSLHFLLSNQCSIRWIRIRGGRTDLRVSGGLHSVCRRMLQANIFLEQYRKYENKKNKIWYEASSKAGDMDTHIGGPSPATAPAPRNLPPVATPLVVPGVRERIVD